MDLMRGKKACKVAGHMMFSYRPESVARSRGVVKVLESAGEVDKHCVAACPTYLARSLDRLWICSAVESAN